MWAEAGVEDFVLRSHKCRMYCKRTLKIGNVLKWTTGFSQQNKIGDGENSTDNNYSNIIYTDNSSRIITHTIHR